MATASSVKSKIQGLIGTANGVTGNADSDLTTAVASLIAGFGAGGSSAPFACGTYKADTRPLGAILTFTVPAEAQHFAFFLSEPPELGTGIPFMTSVVANRADGSIVSSGSSNTGSNTNASSAFVAGANSGYYYGAYFDGDTVTMKTTDTSSNYRKTPQAGKTYVWVAW